MTARAALSQRVFPSGGTDLDAWLSTFIATISSGQSYREPTGTEAADAINGIERLGISGTDASALLTPLGFTITTGYDSVSKRPFALAYNEFSTNRSWGAYLMDTSTPVRLLIECPHPVYDANTELMGLAHWRATPGSLLMIAGAHRDAASGLADPTTNVNCLFDQVAINYAGKNVPQIQWHGFADATAAGLTQVVSGATSQIGSAIKRVGAELANVDGFTVGQYWDSSGSGTSLGATTNVVGQDAATKGTTFIHVENNNTVRTSSTLRAKAVAAVVQAEPEVLYLADFPQLAVAVTGQFPSTIGTANTVGTSNYAARSDHIHKERQNTLDRITALEPATVTLTDAATIATDASLGKHFRVTLGGNRTLGNPTNPTNGQKAVWELIQDGTGSRTLTLGSAFALGTDIASVTLSTTASKRDFLGAVYNSTTSKWYVIAFVKGY